MARPRGEFRRLITKALADGGPATSREIAQRTGIAFGVTMETLNNMVRAGDAVKLEPVRRSGVCRPVPFYGPAAEVAHADAAAELQASLAAAWRAAPPASRIETVIESP